MAVKVNLYSACEGKDSGARTSGEKGGRGGGKFAGQKGKLGVVERSPQQDSAMTIGKKNKVRS